MPQARYSSQYPDIKEIFDRVLENGGGRYTLETQGAAFWWRQRANTFRKRLRDEMAGPTPYDGLRIRVEENVCVIEMHRPTGTFTTLEGTKPVDAIKENDPLLEQALATRRSLGLKL